MGEVKMAECKKCNTKTIQLNSGFCNECVAGTLADALLDNWAQGGLKNFKHDNPEINELLTVFWPIVDHSVNVEETIHEKVLDVLRERRIEEDGKER